MTALVQARERPPQVDVCTVVDRDDLAGGREGSSQARGGVTGREYDRALFKRWVRGVEGSARGDEGDGR